MLFYNEGDFGLARDVVYRSQHVQQIIFSSSCERPATNSFELVLGLRFVVQDFMQQLPIAAIVEVQISFCFCAEPIATSDDVFQDLCTIIWASGKIEFF